MLLSRQRQSLIPAISFSGTERHPRHLLPWHWQQPAAASFLNPPPPPPSAPPPLPPLRPPPRLPCLVSPPPSFPSVPFILSAPSGKGLSRAWVESLFGLITLFDPLSRTKILCSAHPGGTEITLFGPSRSNRDQSVRPNGQNILSLFGPFLNRDHFVRPNGLNRVFSIRP